MKQTAQLAVAGVSKAGPEVRQGWCSNLASYPPLLTPSPKALKGAEVQCTFSRKSLEM